jgi:hypothetical protein
MEAIMPTSKRYTRSNYKRFRREMYDLAVSLRDEDAAAMVRRAFARKARAYSPYVTPHAMSRAKNGTGGPFGELAMWAAAAELSELLLVREWLDATLDRIEAEKCARPMCLRTAVLRQQEADTAEDLEETRALLTGDFRPWIPALQTARAAMREVEIVAMREAR